MNFYNKGDQAGSLPSSGVGMTLSLYPVISIKCIDTSPPVPSRFDLFCLWNIKYLPFGDHAGDSREKSLTITLSLFPFVSMTPMWKLPWVNLVKAIKSPLGDHTGLP